MEKWVHLLKHYKSRNLLKKYRTLSEQFTRRLKRFENMSSKFTISR